MEKAEGNLPTTSSAEGVLNFFIALNENLDVEGYADFTGDGIIVPISDVKGGVQWKGHKFGDENDYFVAANDSLPPWLITADGMAFRVDYVRDATCKKSPT